MHRLVARAFHGPPPSAAHTHVNHLDGDKANNRIDNLEYVTPSENAIHWHNNGSTKAVKAVKCRSCEGGAWVTFPSQREAAHVLGIHPSSVSKCCTGRQKHASGFKFEHAAQAEPAWIPGEVWKAAYYPGIVGAVSSWMVSSHGRVMTRTGHITRGSLSKAGYSVLHWSENATRVHKQLLAHRLVAASFFGQPSPADLLVNHLDGDRANNHVHNLEYATPAENSKHALSRRAGCKIVLPNQKKPLLAREIGLTSSWMLFESATEAAAHTGVSAGYIGLVCRRKSRRAKNWEFKFAASEKLHDEEWRKVILD